MCLCRLSEHVKTGSLFSPGKHLHTREDEYSYNAYSLNNSVLTRVKLLKIYMTFSALVGTGSLPTYTG